MIQNNDFSLQIDKFEKELESLYQQNRQEFADQPLLQAELFLKALAQKIQQFFSSIPDQNKVVFQKYIKQELNLKSDGDVKNFISSAPQEMEKMLEQTFVSN